MLSRSYETLSYQVIFLFLVFSYLYHPQEGFGNHFATESLKGALPKGQNSPQKCAYGLYAEQLSGTAFTAPRASNQRSWLYRIKPCVTHLPFVPAKDKFKYITNDFMDKEKISITPNQLRWKPLPFPSKDAPKTFIEGLITSSGCGHPALKVNEISPIYLFIFFKEWASHISLFSECINDQ